MGRNLAVKIFCGFLYFWWQMALKLSAYFSPCYQLILQFYALTYCVLYEFISMSVSCLENQFVFFENLQLYCWNLIFCLKTIIFDQKRLGFLYEIQQYVYCIVILLLSVCVWLGSESFILQCSLPIWKSDYGYSLGLCLCMLPNCCLFEKNISGEFRIVCVMVISLLFFAVFIDSLVL